MESWRRVWRDGFAPLISNMGLQALRRALLQDDGRLLQGATTAPPPLQSTESWPVEGACGLGYCGWQGERLETVAQVEEFFARICSKRMNGSASRPPVVGSSTGSTKRHVRTCAVSCWRKWNALWLDGRSRTALRHKCH
jgi:hypothetical protein